MNMLIFVSSVTVLFVTLIIFQLRLFREGDRKFGGREMGDREMGDTHSFFTCKMSACPPFPCPPFKNPAYRAIWENMERTRRLLMNKAAQDRRTERLREKRRLGLPEEENILFIGERAAGPLWLFTVPLFALIALSAILPVENLSHLSFACLVLGLAGMGGLQAYRGGKKYYLTNFRVLVRRKPIWRITPGWSAMTYLNMKRYAIRKKLTHTALVLEDRSGSLNIAGLSRKQVEQAHVILIKNTSLNF